MLRGFQIFFSKSGAGIGRSSFAAILTFLALVLVGSMPRSAAAQTIFSPANIGSSVNCTPVDITFSAPGTLTAISVLTQGAPNLDFTASTGSCAPIIEVRRPKAEAEILDMGACTLNTVYAANQYCTAYVKFTPRFAGPRYGAVVLTGTTATANTVLGTGFLQGTGMGPQTTFAVPKVVSGGTGPTPPQPAVDALSALAKALPADTQPTRMLLMPGYQNTIDSNWTVPYGIAVDGAGNVYIADGSNEKVIKETLQANGSYVATEIPGSWLVPVGVAVDGAGNVYVADADDEEVTKETLQSDGITYIASAVDSGEWDEPVGVAVDGAGNVYVADAGGIVVKETLLSDGISYSISTVDSTNLETPLGLAVDGSGSVYVTFDSEDGAGVAKETPQAGGGYAFSSIGSDWEYPVGIAVDSNGNVYVADYEQGVVVRETLNDGGYSDNYLGEWYTPYELAIDPSGVLYVTDDGSNGACIACFYEDAVNSGRPPIKAATASKKSLAARSFSHKAKPNEILNGGVAGGSSTPSVYRLDYSKPPALGFADTYWNATSTDSPQTVIVDDFGNATLSFSALAYPVDFPEEAETEFDCTASFELSASRNCLLTIDFSPVTTPAGLSTLLSENVTLKTNALYTPGGSTQSVAVSGNELATQVASVTHVTSNANPIFALNPVTFTATVGARPVEVPSVTLSKVATPMVAIPVTGTVTFYDGSAALCTARPLTSGSATCSTSSLTTGSHPITAVYSGDLNYYTSTSNVLTEVVTDFTVAVSGGSAGVTVLPGRAGVFTLTVSPVSPATTFPAAITLSASGLPAGATAVFSPSTIAAGAGTTTVTLTIQTALTSASASPAPGGAGGQLASKLAPLSLAFLLLPLIGRVRKAGKRFSRMLVVLLLLGVGGVVLAGLSGCGSGVGYFGLAQRNYNVGVTGTSGALSHTSNVNLTVE